MDVFHSQILAFCEFVGGFFEPCTITPLHLLKLQFVLNMSDDIKENFPFLKLVSFVVTQDRDNNSEVLITVMIPKSRKYTLNNLAQC